MKKADLNPPLGFPGGPCYVSDRAEGLPNFNEVQRSLEQSGGLSRRLETKVYPGRHLQRGSGKLNLLLSSHAQYRLDLRGVTVPLLRRAFMSFEKWFLGIINNRRRSPKDAKRFNELLDDLKQRTGFTWHDKKTNLVLAIHQRPDLPTNTLLIATVYFLNEKDPKAPGAGSCSKPYSYDSAPKPPSDPTLGLITRFRQAYSQPAGELFGVRTFVDEKSSKGISDSGSSSSYLPSDSPKSDKYRAKPLPSTHSKSRDKHIPQPAYNAPGSSQDGNAIKVRTPSTPGAQYGHPYIDQGTSLHKRRTMQASIKRVAARKIAEMTEAASIALMKWLSKTTRRVGVARHVYVVGGAVRNFLINKPIKDIDMVVDSLSIPGGKDAAWVAQQIAKAIPTRTDIVTDALMVSKVFIEGPWLLDGHQMQGEVIEIVNAREEVYDQDEEGNYLGHKPIRVDPTSLETDVIRREFTFNTLMWRLLDLAEGPDKAEIIDLTGCGVRDLQNFEMRCPQSPDKTFKQDPTRILRTIKFAFKYGFKLPPDVKAAARRQAKGLKRIPAKAWSVLRTIVLENPQYKKALLIMDDLGVLQVLREMVQEDRPFATTLSNYAKSKNFSFLFDLMDLGIPIHTPISFLNRAQQARFREIVTPMDRDEALDFLSKLEVPGNAYKDKRFFPTLMRELGIRNGKVLSQRLKPISINLMLSDPSLAYQPERLKRAIKQAVMREF